MGGQARENEMSNYSRRNSHSDRCDPYSSEWEVPAESEAEKPTAPTLGFLMALGGLEFRRMTPGDYMGFSGAADDARMAESQAAAICCPLGISTEYGAAIIVSGQRIEVHGVDSEGSPLSLSWNLEAEVC
jgi:hypothetical protein